MGEKTKNEMIIEHRMKEFDHWQNELRDTATRMLTIQLALNSIQPNENAADYLRMYLELQLHFNMQLERVRSIVAMV